MTYLIRKGEKKDVNAAHGLIMELAVYEKAPEQVTNTPEQMLIDGFGERPIFEFYVAEYDGQVVGLALYYTRYSTWKGRCIYLDDIVITESYRRRGIGKLLFDAVVKESVQQKANLLTWQVLDWNEPAIEFYKKLDAAFDGEWINCKLTKEQLQNWQ